MQVIEAVLIGMILIAAVSFVVTFSSPTNTTEPTRAQLSLTVGDALAIMDEYPLDDARYGNNTLSKLVFEALQGDSQGLTNRLDGLLPDATAYNVYINNGYAFLPVHEPRLPAGESVSVRHPLEPRLSYVFLHTAQDKVSSSTSATLGVYALPVWNSNILTDGGADLEIRVQGINRDTLRTFNLTTYYSTEQAPDGSDLPGAQLMYYDKDGEPGVYIDRFTDAGNTTLYLEVKKTETEGKVPAGSIVTLTSPRGFELEAWRGEADVDDWDVLSNTGTWNDGMVLKVQLKRDLATAGDRAILRFNATSILTPSAPDPYDFYGIHAHMSAGAYAQADAILHYKQSAAPTGGDFHAVVAAVPKPMGMEGTTQWAVGVQSPALANGQTVIIKRVEIVQTSGLPIFNGVSATEAHGGAWALGPTVSGTASDRLIWSGELEMGASTGLDWVIDVTGAGTQTPRQAKEHQLAAVSAFTHTARFHREIAPGLFYGEVPPERTIVDGTLAGYNPTPGSGYVLASLVQPVTKQTVYLPGEYHYGVGVASLRDSLNAINLTFSQRVVPIGQSMTATVDIQNLLLKLSENGVSATTTVRLYAPWALDNHVAWQEDSTTETSFFQAGSGHLALADYTDDGVPDVIVGTTEGEVFVLNGQSGYKIPGLAVSVPSGDINALEVAYLDENDPTAPYLIIGAPPTASGDNLILLNPDFSTRWASDVSPIGRVSQAVTSVNVTTDVNGDGQWLDLVVGDAAGSYYYVDGDTGEVLQWEDPADPLAGGTTVRSGWWTKDIIPGLTATTGTHADVDHPSSLPEPNVGGITEAMKQVSIEHSTGGLIGVSPVEQLWAYPVEVDHYRVDDLDGWGPDDLAVGMYDGGVITLNGTQPALPYGGIEFLTGTQVLDAQVRNTYQMWTVDTSGFVMYTSDGYTTRWYGTDFTGASLAPVQGARAIHITDGTVGYIVGDLGKIWKTTNAGDETTAEVWEPVAYSLTSGESAADFQWKDVWAFDANTVLIGGQCATCGTYAVFRSTDGGATFSRVTFNGHDPDRLDRFHFVDNLNGFALTTDGIVSGNPQGFISVTADGGETWSLRHKGQGETLRGITVLSNGELWAVGDAGTVLHNEDGVWQNFTGISGETANLMDVDFADDENGIIVGKSGRLYRTWDGGTSWVRTRHVGSTYDLNRVLMPLPDHAMVIGGTATTRVFIYAATYAAEATATSPTSALLSGPAVKFRLEPTHRIMPEEADVAYEVSPDGGTTWYDAEAGVEVPVAGGTEFLVRMNLRGNYRFPYVSPQVDAVAIHVWYDDGGIVKETDLAATFSDPPHTLTGDSTAVWDDDAGGIRLPRLDTFWEQNVNGEVLDLDVGRDWDDDGLNEVLVGTGWVLDDNGVSTGVGDNRTYLLNGANGTVLWKTPELDGPVRGVRFANLPGLTGDAIVDAVAFVDVTQELPPELTAYDPCSRESTITYVYYIDGADGSLILDDGGEPLIHEICGVWNSGVVGDLTQDGSHDVIVGQQPGAANTPGYVTAVDTANAEEWMWRTAPAASGLYTLQFKAPMNAIFGAYVVEVEVTGEEIIDGALTDFTARTINYFLVTPPSGVLPTSPIYTIEVVAWFHDWDFAPGAILDTTPTGEEDPGWEIETNDPRTTDELGDVPS